MYFKFNSLKSVVYIPKINSFSIKALEQYHRKFVFSKESKLGIIKLRKDLENTTYDKTHFNIALLCNRDDFMAYGGFRKMTLHRNSPERTDQETNQYTITTQIYCNTFEDA